MVKVPTLEGIFPAIVTPFTADGDSVDDDALRQVVQFQLDAGVGGVIPCGSTGEFMSMSPEERMHVVDVVIGAVNGAVPVVAHTGAMTTKEAVRLSTHAEESGAAAVMVIPPYYEPITWPELLAHYQALSDSLEIPIMYYHMPAATGQPLTRAQFEQLAEIENVRFTKDSSADAVQLGEILQEMSGRLTPFNGEDKLTFFGLTSGGRASVWGAATFFPSLAVELYDAIILKQSLVDAQEVWRRIWPIMSAMAGVSYQSAVKAGCELVGLPVGVPRLPMMPAPKEFSANLAAVLQASGLAVTA